VSIHTRSGKKRKKTIKSRGGDAILVVREDPKVAQFSELEGRPLVGKFVGRM
jgi:hypothetical protein